MNRTTRITAAVVVVVLAAALLFWFRPRPQPTAPTVVTTTQAPENGWAAGVVTATDGTPVEDAVVSLSRDGRVYTDATDASGQFRMSVPPGEYELTVKNADGQRIAKGRMRVAEGQLTQVAINTPVVSETAARMEALSLDFMELQSANEAQERQLMAAQRELAARPITITVNPPNSEFTLQLPAPPPVEMAEMPPEQITLEEKKCENNDAPCRVEVFFATDRRRLDRERHPTSERNHRVAFGRDRSKDAANPITYGWCDVTVPRNHRKMTGVLQSGTYDPKTAVFIHDVIPAANTDEFMDRLRLRIGQDQKREMFVFIHGYNIPFSEAARRTAQMHYDLGFHGAPAFFSWPSQGRLLGYLADEASTEWTAVHLRAFLDLLASKSGATKIHLIAHSMGNRPLLRALADIGRCEQEKCASSRGPRSRFSQVIMAAPDLDTDMFVQLKEAMQMAAERVTIYASRKDRAILGSVFIHRFDRLGVPKPPPHQGTKLEVIDASRASTGFLGHSYYGSSILWDVRGVLVDPRRKASERCTIAEAIGSAIYPSFVPQLEPGKKKPGVLTRAWLYATKRRQADPAIGECKVQLPAPVPAAAAAGRGTE